MFQGRISDTLSFYLLQGFHNFSCNKSVQYHIIEVMALIGLNKTTPARKCMHVQYTLTICFEIRSGKNIALNDQKC